MDKKRCRSKSHKRKRMIREFRGVIKDNLSDTSKIKYILENTKPNLRKFLFEQFTDELRLQIENDILDTLDFWLPFIQVKDLKIEMSDATAGSVNNNKLIISVVFNITRDPNTLESVQVEIGD